MPTNFTEAASLPTDADFDYMTPQVAAPVSETTSKELDAAVYQGFLNINTPRAEPVQNIEGLNTFQSAAFAFQEWSTLSAVYSAGSDLIQRPSMHVLNEDFINNRLEWEKAEPIREAVLKEMRVMSKQDPVAFDLLTEYEWSLNEEAGQHWVDRYIRYKQIAANRELSGGIGYAAGAVLGVLADALVLNLGAGASVANSARAAAMNAAKLAFPEVIIDTAARSIYDPSFNAQDAFLQLTIGLGAAGGLGAGIQKLRARKVSKIITADTIVKSADDLQPTSKSVGAAAIEDYTGEIALAKSVAGADMGVVSKVLDNPVGRLLRGPRGMIKSMRSALTQKVDTLPVGSVSNKSYTAVLEVLSSMDRMMKTSEVTSITKGGNTMMEAMEEGVNRMRQETQVHLHDVDTMIDNWMDSAYEGQVGRYMKSLQSNLPGVTKPVREDIKAYSTILSVSKDNVSKWDAPIEQLNTKIDEIDAKIELATSKAAELGEEAKTAFLQAQREVKVKQLELATTTQNKGMDALQEVEGVITERGTTAGDAQGFFDVVSKVSQERDKYYHMLGERMQKDGLITEEQLRMGYRPQSWNAEEIGRDAGRTFKPMLWNQLREVGPDEDFIRKALGDEFPEVNTLDDLIEADPRLARQVMEEHEEVVADALEDTLRRNQLDAEHEFGGSVGITARNFIDEAQRNIDERVKFITARQAELDKLNDSVGMAGHDWEMSPKQFKKAERLHRSIGKHEYYADMWRQKQAQAQGMLDGITSVEDMLKRMGRDIKKVNDPRVMRNAKRQLDKSLNKASRQYRMQMARNSLLERVDEMYETMSAGRAIGDFTPDEFIQSSARFKKRAIDLTGVYHKDEWQKFLNHGDDDILIGYSEATGRQMELEEKMGQFLRNEGALSEGSHNVADAWVLWANRKIDDAIASSGDLETRTDLLKFKKELVGIGNENGMLQKGIKEFTRADRLEMYKTEWGGATDQALGVLSTAMNAMLLGRVSLTLPTDLASTLAGGQHTTTGLRSVFGNLIRGNWLGGIKNIQELDRKLAMVIQGEHIMAGANISSRFDADNSAMFAGGSFGRRIQRGREIISAVASWTNGMQPWNMFVRSSVGLDAAADILEDAARRSSMDDTLRRTYAMAGLGDDATRGINDLDAIDALAKKLGVIEQSGRTVANTSNWHKYAVVFENGKARVVSAAEVPPGVKSVSGTHMQNKYFSATRTFANQMHLDPAIGDRPFWSKSVHGRVIMSMQSFMYAASDRFVQPMVQRVALDKQAAMGRVGGAIMLGMGLGVLGQGVRDILDDRDTAIRRFLENDGELSGEDWAEILRIGFRRSPMSIGMLDRFWEGFSVAAGDHLNEALGFKAFDETPVKFRQGQSIAASLAGPAVGTFSRVDRMLTSPDQLTWDKVSRITLPFNSIVWQTMQQHFFDSN